MRSFKASRTALAPLLPCFLLGSLGTSCNARLDISDETSDAGIRGGGGAGMMIGDPSLNVDAGTPRAGCDDGVRSGEETDIDCGGDACGACTMGASCQRHEDCTSGRCLAGVCGTTSCEDGVQNGDETGIDCGGACLRCRTSTCNCASSPELMPLECDETEGYLSVACGTRFLSADGETFVFAICRLDRPNGSMTGYEMYRRKPDGTRDALGDAGALGLSSDGQRLLIYDSSAVSVVNADGTRTVVPIPQASATDARITGDGVSVFGGVPNGVGGRTLARWTPSGGLETLGDLPVANAGLWHLGALSHDGSVAVGHSENGTRSVPFRWTAQGGVEDLGALPTGADGARPTAISADGFTIAGVTLAGAAEVDVFRWTATDQLQAMGAAVPYSYLPDATLRLSADGAILAGNALLNGASSIVRWGTGGTVVANAGQAFVSDMTPDGSVLVGSTEGAGFLWRPPAVELTTPESAYDVTPVQTLLERLGADATGWALESITNISDDARIIYGTGTCGGVPTYYRMQLSP